MLRRADEHVDVGQPQVSSQKDVVLGGLRVNASAQSVSLHGKDVEFSTQEFVLLWELINNAGTILSRDELFKRIRGIEYDGLDRSVDVRVSKIRKKLGDDPNNPQKIKTVWGKGYLLSPTAWDVNAQDSGEKEPRKEEASKEEVRKKVADDKGAAL